MARKRRPEHASSDHQDAFPSSPIRPPIIGIYITNDDKEVLNYVSFSKEYAAAAFIQDCVERHGKPDAVKSIHAHLHGDAPHDLLFESGWRLSTRQNSLTNDLPGLLKYKFTSKEAEFTIPENIALRYKILGGTADKPIEDDPAGEVKQQSTTRLASSARRTPRPEGLIPLADLTNDPGEARKLLRKAKMDKPSHGWAWPKDHPDLAKVKKLLAA